MEAPNVRMPADRHQASPCGPCTCHPLPRLCRRHEDSPELALALEGVAFMKLFLGGPAVSEELTVERLVEVAEEQGVAVVLPIHEVMGLAGAAPPAWPL